MYTTLCHSRAGRKRLHLPQVKNEDRVMTRLFSERDTGTVQTALVAVADGVSRCADGGAVAEWLLQDRINRDAIFAHAAGDLDKRLGAYLRGLHKEYLKQFSATPEMIESGCTLALVKVSGQRATVFWSGDSPVHHMHLKDGVYSARTLTFPDCLPGTGTLTDCFSGVTPFDFNTVAVGVRPGDILIAASDGVIYDGATLALTLDRFGFNQAWMEQICEKSYSIPLSDDISMSAVRIDSTGSSV